jgi:hypothetical protein
MKAVINVFRRLEKRRSRVITPARKSNVTMILVDVLHLGEMDFSSGCIIIFIITPIKKSRAYLLGFGFFHENFLEARAGADRVEKSRE